MWDRKGEWEIGGMGSRHTQREGEGGGARERLGAQEVALNRGKTQSEGVGEEQREREREREREGGLSTHLVAWSVSYAVDVLSDAWFWAGMVSNLSIDAQMNTIVAALTDVLV